jgi:hypothetical protein
VGFLGMGLFSHLRITSFPSQRKEIYHHPHHHNLLLSNIPYPGGGDYRGIYDIGIKRGFMGYIDLLLNDPYKIEIG